MLFSTVFIHCVGEFTVFKTNYQMDEFGNDVDIKLFSKFSYEWTIIGDS